MPISKMSDLSRSEAIGSTALWNSNGLMNLKIAVILLSLLVLSTCIIFILKVQTPDSSRAAQKDLTPSLIVGGHLFSKTEVANSQLVEMIKYPFAKTFLGANALRRAYTYEILMTELGHKVTPAQLENELSRINVQSMDQEKWTQMKNIFKGDHEQLLKILILPIYVASTLPFRVFPRSEKVHGKVRHLATQLHQQVLKDPTRLAALATQNQVKTLKLCVWKNPDTASVSDLDHLEYLEGEKCNSGQVDAPTKALVDMSPGATASAKWKKKIFESVTNKNSSGRSLGSIWIQQLAPKISVGQASPRLIETPAHYFIVRLDSKRANKSKRGTQLSQAKFTYAQMEKINFDQWVQERKASLGL